MQPEALSEIAALAAGELLGGEEVNEHGLPPGFRFHPTDEELITFYLASKVFHGSFCGVQIAEIDLNRCEPWDLPADVAKMGEKEWYFFSLRDRKYPTGLRTNRATGAGYWKATGKDREVYSTGRPDSNSMLLGMKKTLVFYKGRAPKGEKTKWVMHEYRLEGHFSYRHHSTSKEEWVICRIFHKTVEKKSGIFLHGLQELAAASASLSSPSGNSYNNNNNNPAGALPALSEAAAAAPPSSPSSWELSQPHQSSSCCFKALHHFPNPPAADFLAAADHGDLKTILTNAINVTDNNNSSNHGFDDDYNTGFLRQCKTELGAAGVDDQPWPSSLSSSHDNFHLPPPAAAATAFLDWGCTQDHQRAAAPMNNDYTMQQNPFPCLYTQDDDSATNVDYSSPSATAAALSYLGFQSLTVPSIPFNKPSGAGGGFHAMMLDAATAPTVARSSCLGDSWSSLMAGGHSSWPTT
ncbi:unnamed protein product [Linum tenue]|uniref:NAC domain-containing protein n=1 Tax=Linum tenue TaxID=586396 RepID=A0AAV0LKJ6_9ROSI|nr:unnamed protein product [Linum tenue]